MKPTADSISIQPMVPADFAEALELWKSTEAIGLNESDTEPAIRQYLERNPGFSFVARDASGVLVGAVLCGHDGRRGLMYHLAVAKQHRLKRIGIQLVDLCLAKLKAANIPRCFILVYADNEEGKTFWKLHDWDERHDMRVMQYFVTGNKQP